MKNIGKRCLFCVLVASLWAVAISTAWAEDQRVAYDAFQENTGKIRKMISQLETIHRANEEILQGINYLKMRIHKKGGGRRPDLELIVDCQKGQRKCEKDCGDECEKRCEKKCEQEG